MIDIITFIDVDYSANKDLKMKKSKSSPRLFNVIRAKDFHNHDVVFADLNVSGFSSLCKKHNLHFNHYFIEPQLNDNVTDIIKIMMVEVDDNENDNFKLDVDSLIDDIQKIAIDNGLSFVGGGTELLGYYIDNPIACKINLEFFDKKTNKMVNLSWHK